MRITRCPVPASHATAWSAFTISSTGSPNICSLFQRSCRMDLELTGKVAVVTGASRGVGKAIARELAKEGVDVAICARHREALEEAASELEQETGRRILPVPTDTTNWESVRRMVET